MTTALDHRPPSGAESRDVAGRIVAKHRACVTAYESALLHAIDCGNLLYEVRRRLHGGTFSRWFKDNLAEVLDERTARCYMQIAHAHKQDPHGLAENAGGSVQAAVNYLSRQLAGPSLNFGEPEPDDDPVVDAEVVEPRYPVTLAQVRELVRHPWQLPPTAKHFDAEVRRWFEQRGVAPVG